MRTLIRLADLPGAALVWYVLAGMLALFFGLCAGCCGPECRGDEPARASPQIPPPPAPNPPATQGQAPLQAAPAPRKDTGSIPPTDDDVPEASRTVTTTAQAPRDDEGETITTTTTTRKRRAGGAREGRGHTIFMDAPGSIVIDSPNAIPAALPQQQAVLQSQGLALPQLAQGFSYQTLPQPAPTVAAVPPVVIRRILGRLYYSTAGLGSIAVAQPATLQVIPTAPVVQQTTYLQTHYVPQTQLVPVQVPVQAQAFALPSPQAAAFAIPLEPPKCGILGRLIGR